MHNGLTLDKQNEEQRTIFFTKCFVSLFLLVIFYNKTIKVVKETSINFQCFYSLVDRMIINDDCSNFTSTAVNADDGYDVILFCFL